jgi:CheY-like chemotaxis protein
MANFLFAQTLTIKHNTVVRIIAQDALNRSYPVRFLVLELDMAQEPGIGIPLDVDEVGSERNRAHLRRQERAARHFATARILIIDDYEPFRASVKDLLEVNGYDVAVAVDGEDGIQQFQLEPFDLVLCDVFMPKKEGMETIRDLRQLSAGTPIISVTGRSDASETDFLRMTRELGATRAITKPFEVDEFLALVRRCLAIADWKRS